MYFTLSKPRVSSPQRIMRLIFVVERLIDQLVRGNVFEFSSESFYLGNKINILKTSHGLLGVLKNNKQKTKHLLNRCAWNDNLYQIRHTAERGDSKWTPTQ